MCTYEIQASFRLQVSTLTLIENEAQKQNLLTLMTAPYSSPRHLHIQRLRGHKKLFHGGWMRSQTALTYAVEKLLHYHTIQRQEIPSSSINYSHPSPCPSYSSKNNREGAGERNREWKEFVLGEEEKGGREDQGDVTCLYSGIANSCKFKKTQTKTVSGREVTNILPQKVNLELFLITRTIKYKVSWTFLSAAKEVKLYTLYSNAQHQSSLTAKPCQKSEISWHLH